MSKPVTLQLYLIFFLVIAKTNLHAQGEASQWFLNRQQHYTFTKKGFSVQPSIPITINQPLTSVSDSAGNLLLIAANGVIYDRNYNELPFYSGQTQRLYIFSGNTYLIRKPGSFTQYYFFYPAAVSNSNTNLFGIYYTLIDLSLNNGNGDVILYDSLIDDHTSRGFTVISAGNEDDFWVVTHKQNTNNFNSWNVTASGLNTTPVKSTAGMDINTNEYDYPHLKASPDGKFIAGVPSYHFWGLFPYFRRFVELYDFDSATGKVSTHVKSIDDADVGGVDDDIEFSADSRLLYVKYDYYDYGLQPCGFAGGDLRQFNTCYTDSVSFTNYCYFLGSVSSFCAYYLWGNIQLAPDKKIYLLYSGADKGMSIQNPNIIGRSAGYQSSVPGFKNEGGVALPSSYQAYLHKAIQNNIVYSGGCYLSPLNFSITNNALQHVIWNFDDATSGANNTSTILNPSHSFASPGIYNVSAILFNTSNIAFDTIYNTVEIKDPLKRLLTGFPKDTSMCAGQTFAVGLSAINGIFFWRKRDMDYLQDIGCFDSLQIGSWGDGTYIVEMHQNDCNGCILTDSITFHTLRTPDIYLADSDAFCEGDSLQLYTYNPGAATIWNTGDTAQIIWAKQAGIYSVQEEYDHNGCVVRDSIKVKSNPSVQFTLPNDTTLCSDATLLLDPGVGDASYRWQDNSNENTYLITQPGKYWTTITNSYNCFASDTINVSYVSGNGVYLGSDTSLCEGDSLLLRSNINNASYLWSTGETTSTVHVKQTGNYWLKASNGTCSVSDTIHVTFNKKPIFSLGNDTSLCEHAVLLLNAGITGDYLWKDGSTNSNYTIQNAGLYTLQVTQNGCSSSDSILVNYKPLPVVHLGNDTGFCAGESLLLNAFSSNINSYLWQDNSTQPDYSVTAPGNYYVHVTGNNGCMNADTISITVTQPPSFSLGTDTALCDQQTLAYNFNISGATYLWNNGDTHNRYTINSAGIYWLKVSQGQCSSSDTITVNYNPLPKVNLGKDTSVCAGTAYTLNAYNSGANYLWQDNSRLSTYRVTNPGSYYVSVDLNGCVQNDTVQIAYSSPPVFSLGNDTSLCPGQTIMLEPKVNGLVSYKWQDGSRLDHYTITAAGSYTLQVTNNCGSSTDELNVSTAVCLLEMPTAFTPNNDGLNDVFRVRYSEFIKEFDMVIYNRWGEKIFETKDPHNGWDGNLKSLPQNEGSYVWVIKLTDHNNKAQTAHGLVTLIR
jgi:gliding motility-associated-like protein